VRLLLEAGAQVIAAGRKRSRPTPLHLAAQENRLEVARVLLEFRAPLEATMLSGTTPLLSAAQRGHSEMVAYLLEVGADPEAVLRGRFCALILASFAGHRAVVEVMLSQGRPSLKKLARAKRAAELGEQVAVLELLQQAISEQEQSTPPK